MRPALQWKQTQDSSSVMTRQQRLNSRNSSWDLPRLGATSYSMSHLGARARLRSVGPVDRAMDNTVHRTTAKVGGAPQSESRLAPVIRHTSGSCSSNSVGGPFIPCPKQEAERPQCILYQRSNGMRQNSQGDLLESQAFEEFFLRGEDTCDRTSPLAPNDADWLERESDWRMARTPSQHARRLRCIKLVTVIVATLGIGAAVAIVFSLATKSEPTTLFQLGPSAGTE